MYVHCYIVHHISNFSHMFVDVNCVTIVVVVVVMLLVLILLKIKIMLTCVMLL